MAPQLRRILEVLSVGLVLALWVVHLLFVPVTAVLTPFLTAPVLVGSLFGLVVLSLVWAAALVMVRPFSWRSVWPFALCVAALALYFAIPVSTIHLHHDFHDKRVRLDTAARRLAAQSATDLVTLPPNERDLSDGGEAYITKVSGRRYVLFWYYRGILDDYEAYVYVPPGGSISSFTESDGSVVDERLGDRWYSVYGD